MLSPFLLPPFIGGKRKWEKNNLSRGQKSCLSARSKLLYQYIYLYIYFRMKMSEELDSEDVFLATSNASFNTSYLDYNITIPDYCPVLTKRVKIYNHTQIWFGNSKNTNLR